MSQYAVARMINAVMAASSSLIDAANLALLWQISAGWQTVADSQISFSVIHRWSAFGGPTMAGTTLDWKNELGRWLKPFLDRLGHKTRRQMCPLYVAGLIGPGDRKSVQPMASPMS